MKIPEEVKISDNGFVFNSKTGDSFSLNPFGLELIKNIQEEKEFETSKPLYSKSTKLTTLLLKRTFMSFAPC
jgi:hypothetical protein